MIPYQFEPIGRHSDIQVMDAGLQDFEVSAVRAWHVKVGKLVRRARQAMTDQQITAVLLHLRILIVFRASLHRTIK